MSVKCNRGFVVVRVVQNSKVFIGLRLELKSGLGKYLKHSIFARHPRAC